MSSISVHPDSDIVYTVEVTSSNGCKTKGIAIVYVSQNPNPTGSLLHNTLSQVLIYPNPASNILTIESSENLKISFYNTQGALVLTKEVAHGKSEFNINNLANAIYTLMIENKLGTKKISKIEILK